MVFLWFPLESRAHLLTSFLQALFTVWILICSVSHTLALNKTHNTAKDYPWPNLYNFWSHGYNYGLLALLPLVITFLAPYLLRSWNKQQAPKWIRISVPSYDEGAVQ